MEPKKQMCPDVWGFAMAVIMRDIANDLTDSLMQRFKCYHYNPEILTRSIELWIKTLIKGEILK